jgi:hypothetical protein
MSDRRARESRATVFHKCRGRCARVCPNEPGGDEKPLPGAENAERISDFSAGGAARHSAQKRSAPEEFALLRPSKVSARRATSARAMPNAMQQSATIRRFAAAMTGVLSVLRLREDNTMAHHKLTSANQSMPDPFWIVGDRLDPRRGAKPGKL